MLYKWLKYYSVRTCQMHKLAIVCCCCLCSNWRHRPPQQTKNQHSLQDRSYNAPVARIFFLWCNLSYPIFLVFTVYIFVNLAAERLVCVGAGCHRCRRATVVLVLAGPRRSVCGKRRWLCRAFAAALSLSHWAPAGPQPLLSFMKGSKHGSKHTVWLCTTHWRVWA